MNKYQLIILAVFVFMSVIGNILMWIDKRRAIKGKWRISETTLFIPAILFGGVGSLLGLHIFKHKTKHWYFKYGFTLLAILDVIVLIFALIYLR